MMATAISSHDIKRLSRTYVHTSVSLHLSSDYGSPYLGHRKPVRRSQDIVAMPGSQEKAEENGHTLMKKVEEDEVIEDEFNIHSTVGLVSALLLSCLASTVSDSKDLKDFAEERDRRWELQDEGVSIFDVYQALIFVSMSCNSVLTTVNFATASVTSDHASLCMFVKHRIRGNVLAIMTAIARLIAFQRVAKSDAPEFQRIMGEGRVG